MEDCRQASSDCSAALKIQAWYRRKRFKRRFLRYVIDKRLAKDHVLGLELYHTGKILLQIYSRSLDQKRLLMFANAVLSSMQSNDPKVWYVSNVSNSSVSVDFIKQMKQFLSSIVKALKPLKPGMPKDDQLIKPYLTNVVILTDCSLWKLTTRPGGAALKPVLHKLCTSMILHLLDQGLFECLHELLLNALCYPVPKFDGHQLQAAMGLRTIAMCGFTDDILSLFIINVLTVPACVWHLNKLYSEGVQQLMKVRLVSRILIYLKKSDFIKLKLSKKNKTEILAVFSNLLQLRQIELKISSQSSAVTDENDELFAIVMNELLDHIHHERRLQSATTTWHLLFGWSDHYLEKRILDCLPHLQKQLCSLWDRDLVDKLFQPVLSLDLTQSKSTKSQGFSFTSLLSSKTTMDITSQQKVLTSAKFYQLCVVCLPQLSTDILIGLSCNHKLPCSLWYYIQTIASVKVKDCVQSMKTPLTDKYAPVLMVLCKVTQYLLSMLDDNELFENQKYFPLTDLKNMAIFLNNLVFTCVWDGIVSVKTSSTLARACVALLALLLQRNRRMPFLTKNDLQIKALKINTFMSEWKARVPRSVELLHHMPHLIPHRKRIEVFYEYIKAEKIEMGIRSGHSPTSATYITVHRARLLESGFEQLSTIPAAAMKGVIRVNFVNMQGLEEAGIDETGVFKEFLEETIKLIFNPEMSLFKSNIDGHLYPSPLSSVQQNHLQLLEFTGKMLGKAVYEGIVVDLPFALFFLRHLVKHPYNLLYSSLDELHSMDAELSKSLHFIKHYDGDVDDLCLTFSFDEEFLGKVVTHELIPGGSGVPVTQQNKISYVHYVAHYKMATQLKDQLTAFLNGFHSIINPQWMAIFTPDEFQKVISGDDTDINIDDLRKHTQYYGGFHDKHPVIVWLWDVLKKDFTPSNRAAFLKFVTSCSRPPLLGFSQLDPSFSIRRVDTSQEEESISVTRTLRSMFSIGSGSQDRLPTSSTCFNLLKLPHYSSKKILREKLLVSVTSNAGFELS